MPPDAGEFEGDLVALGEAAPAGFVAAEEGVRTRADDEFIAGIIAAALQHRALHGGDYITPGAMPGRNRGLGKIGGGCMHTKILAAILCSALLFAAARARADETPPADEKPAADAPIESKAIEDTTADSTIAPAAKADTVEKITLPPGFKPKKRGKYTLYCRKETVMGTRLPAQKCYDENGIRQIAQSLREEREKIDQLRRICGSLNACGGGG